MVDLTILYITANRVPEEWAERQYNNVLAAANSRYPILTISRKPGGDIHDTAPISYENIYRCMLAGAKLADTQYIAVAEDDVLYTEEHFKFFRPDMDTFGYNQHRFALMTWDPMYSWRNRKSNCSLIAPRKLTIAALEERFSKYPDGIPAKWCGELGRSRVDKWLGVTVRKSKEVFSKTAIIQFNHIYASDDRQRRKRKAHGPLRAYDIPHWGRADKLAELFT